MNQKNLASLKLEIQLAAKNGINFICAASLVWLLISIIWTLDYSSYDKSVFTFIVGSLLLPLAYLFSKLLKTKWVVKDNPLQPLGLWLNFAQLIYFPFLIFILISDPDYFVMTYAIITGAHFFPYAWFYDEKGYAIWAVLISVGSLILALAVEPATMSIIPLFVSVMMATLGGKILIGLRSLNSKNI